MATRKKTTKDAPKPARTAVRRTRPRATKNGDAQAPEPKGNNLVIVESPAKAKTINKYLGGNFKVLASYGHVRDLPKRRKKGDVSAPSRRVVWADQKR